MLLALVSTMDSITSLPLPFSTAITIASLCTSMPIYLMSRLIQLPPWGKDHSRQRSLSLKVKCHSLADLPIFSSGSCPHPRFSPLNGPLSHNASTPVGQFSMSSIKRDVKKKALPRPEGEKSLSRDPAHFTVRVPLDLRERFCF